VCVVGRVALSRAPENLTAFSVHTVRFATTDPKGLDRNMG
jgi:hypothetical protein